MAQRLEHRGAGPFPYLRMRIEHLEDPFRCGHGLLQVGVDPAQFLDRRVHHQRRDHEQQELPFGQLRRVRKDLAAAVPDQEHRRRPAQHLHERRQDRQRARHLQVGAVELVRRRPEAGFLVRLCAEGLDDPMAGEGFGGHVGEVLELFLAAPGGSPDPLAQTHQRMNGQRRDEHRHHRQLPVHEEQHDRERDQRQPLAKQISQRLRDRLLDLVDVVGDPRHQRAGAAAREEPGRLVEDVPEQPVADVAYHPLPDVGHQERREVSAQTLEKIATDHEPGERRERDCPLQDGIDQRLDLVGDRGVGCGVDHHSGKRRDEPPAVRAGVGEQAMEWIHSVNRYFSSTHSATKPSRQVIFLPSS